MNQGIAHHIDRQLAERPPTLARAAARFENADAEPIKTNELAHR